MPSAADLTRLLATLQAAKDHQTFHKLAMFRPYAKQQRFAEALGEFAELARRHPDYVPGYFMAGRTAEQDGNVAEAKRLYGEGIAAARRTGDRHAEGEISQALGALE